MVLGNNDYSAKTKTIFILCVRTFIPCFKKRHVSKYSDFSDQKGARFPRGPPIENVTEKKRRESH